jgi:branched-chain amino acid aminotransferase
MFYGFDSLGYSSYDECPTHTVIATWPVDSDEIVTRRPIDVTVSSWRKVHHTALPTTAKLSGMYLNSVMASKAVDDEYDRPLLLNENGTLAEGAADNVFVVEDDTVATPDIDSSILNGITRQTVLTLARDRGYDVQTKDITRHEAMTADEVFLTSTGSGITPVESIDDEVIGEAPGPVTTELQETYVDAITRKTTSYDQWVDEVEQ